MVDQTASAALERLQRAGDLLSAYEARPTFEARALLVGELSWVKRQAIKHGCLQRVLVADRKSNRHVSIDVFDQYFLPRAGDNYRADVSTMIEAIRFRIVQSASRHNGAILSDVQSAPSAPLAEVHAHGALGRGAHAQREKVAVEKVAGAG